MEKALQESFINVAPLFVIRHGRSAGQDNPDLYREIGDDKLDITETGQKQSYCAALVLREQLNDLQLSTPVIYHSTCARGAQTAQVIESVLRTGNLLAEPRLNKQKFGAFDGLLSDQQRQTTLPDLFAQYARDLQEAGPYYARPPQGESIADVVDRISAALSDISAKQTPAILVTHGLPYSAAEKTLLRKNENWLLDQQDAVPNTAIKFYGHNPQTGLFTAKPIHENEVSHPERLFA